jgi:general secretion pathway protein A
MYNDFYGFARRPSTSRRIRAFLFASERHREAFDHLLFGIRERKGFIQLTGEVGAGKTTLCRAALEALGPTFRTALILNPCLTAAQLMRAILVEPD